MSAPVARLVAESGGIGRLFFCDMRLSSASGEPAIADALALAERLLGPIARSERRETASHVLLQVLHRDGALAQIACRTGAPDALAIELDGDAGSLRLAETGRLVRHDAGAAAVLIDAGTPALLRAHAHAPP